MRRAKAPAAKPVLWEVKDSVGIVTGKYADPATCASSLVSAFEASDDVEDLQRLWEHNKTLIARLQAMSVTSGSATNNGNGCHNSGNGSGGNNSAAGPRSVVIDLLGPYQARYTALRDPAINVESGSGTAKRQENVDGTQDEAAANPKDPASLAPKIRPKEAIDKSQLTIGSPKAAPPLTPLTPNGDF